MINAIRSWFSKEAGNVEPLYRTREVWTYRHFDSKTKRAAIQPVLVFRKASDGMFWGLPLTKTNVNGNPLYVPRLVNGKKVPALSQMRTLKASRLVRKIGTAGEREFGALNSAIVRLLAETAPVKTKKVRAPLPRQSERFLSPLSSVYLLQPR